MLINGAAGNLISIRDRGLLYGDGVFRTLCVRQGVPLHWSLHYLKLRGDCAALGIVCPSESCLFAELSVLTAQYPNAVCKIIITRGVSLRGYAPAKDATPSHIWDVSDLPDYPENRTASGIALHLCTLRLAAQPRLAGIKHLNRLENVLAAGECADMSEGLLLDEDGYVIEGTRSNIFIVKQGKLVTPDLSRCGVAGVQRDRVINHARNSGMTVEIREVALTELYAADEVFLTNSVFGLWSVAQLEQRHWQDFSWAAKFRADLDS
jgi:4-amino-4-deoxychorismate lyase